VKRCFEGRVIEATKKLCTADLICLTDDNIPSVLVTFRQAVIEDGPVEAGDIIDVIKKDGQMHVRKHDLGVWSKEDLDKIWDRARRRAEEVAKWTD
jgi:hypothetical protein